MKKNIDHVAPKVALAFIVLLAIVIGSLVYMLNFVEQIAAEEDINSVPRQKIYLVTNTQTLLYESETMGQLLDMEEDDYTYFNETLDKAHDNMDSLRLLVTDTLLLHRIDTIDILIERKRINTDSLMRLWSEASTDLYAKNIKKAMEKPVPNVEEKGVKERLETNKDTVIVQGKKRGFFQRLAEVFVPTAQDSSIIVRANEQLVKDSLLNTYNPNEAINTTLRNIQSSVSTERQRLRELLVDRSSALRYDNSLITRRINQILRDMEEEELSASMERMQKRQQILENTSYLITGVAFFSLIISIFFLILIGRDLFKSKYYRKQLESEKEYTEGLLHKREKLMLTISHDIRAPLSSIIGYLELLQRSNPNEQQRSYLDNMTGSSKHILSLVNDLLDIQRLESGQMEIHPVQLRVPELFREIYESFLPQANAKKLQLKLHFQEDNQYVYSGDTVRIRQVVGNLINNALKFTTEGSVEVIVDCQQLEVPTEGEEVIPVSSQLQVTVRDTGAGIAPEEQKRIFEEFTRLAGSENAEGFGLGLSITGRLVALMGGEISLESKVGEGSDFIIRLPLPLSENQSLPQQETVMDLKTKDKKPSPFANHSFRCLIVDDDLLQIALMEEILKNNNIKSVSCTNPYAVLDILRNESFDIVLTDMYMPGMDGFTLIRLIRESDLPVAGYLPVIVLSGSVGIDKRKFIEAGFTDAIGKPFTSEQLLSLMAELLLETKEKTSELNFNALAEFAGGDEESSTAIIQTFFNETRKNVNSLKEALEDADRVKAQKIAHKLIPLFSLLDANTLVQQLTLLQRNDIELNDSGWKRLLEDVITQVAAIVNEGVVC